MSGVAVAEEIEDVSQLISEADMQVISEMEDAASVVGCDLSSTDECVIPFQRSDRVEVFVFQLLVNAVSYNSEPLGFRRRKRLNRVDKTNKGIRLRERVGVDPQSVNRPAGANRLIHD